EGEDPARFVRVDGDLAAAVVHEALVEADAVSPGNVAVIVPRDLAEPTAEAFAEAGVEVGRATRSGLEAGITLVPVDLVKGLELDAALVVEPAAIVESGPKGLKALYVALTRATHRLTVVHARDLPPSLRE
ncbi:MAG: ATP-binding domain-containing protein, partial [Actinomycetota bacterium]